MPSLPSSSGDGIRLNRFLASCGLGSRRACEQLITEGRIEINGKICIDLATRVQPGDAVRFDGRMLQQARETTLLLNKPKGYICSRGDTHDRDTIYNLLPPAFHHLPHIGRLDQDSRGLILLSNSGELSEHLSHPRHKIEKEYHLTLNQAFDHEHIERLLRGIRLEEGLARATSVTPLGKRRISVVLQQGYKRQLRRMLDAIGYRVQRLERVRIGNLTAPGLAEGKWKLLTDPEIKAAMMITKPPRKRQRSRKRID